MTTTTVVTGNPKPGSRTRLAAHRVARELTGAAADADIDLATFGPALLDWASDDVAAAVEVVRSSSLVIVASPTYKGTYTGLLKLFLDRFGAGALGGTPAMALMLGGDTRHSLAPQAFLTPVLSEIGAATPVPGLFLVDSTWDALDALDAWLPQARAALAATAALHATLAAAADAAPETVPTAGTAS